MPDVGCADGPDVLAIGGDSLVTLAGAELLDPIRGTMVPINDGTATWTLTDASGSTISTGTMPYVSGSSGGYESNIPASITANLTENALYFVKILLTTPANNKSTWRIRLRARYREGGTC